MTVPTIARALVALPVRSTALVGLLPPGRGVASDVCACALLAIAECLLRCLAPRARTDGERVRMRHLGE